MKNLLSKKHKEDIIKVCTKWIENNLTVQEVKNTIDELDWAFDVAFSRPNNTHGYISSNISILIDDILEMDSISDEEKDKSILELVARHQEELTDLAKKAIKQIEINHQEFLEEAEKRGYCPILTKNQ